MVLRMKVLTVRFRVLGRLDQPTIMQHIYYVSNANSALVSRYEMDFYFSFIPDCPLFLILCCDFLSNVAFTVRIGRSSTNSNCKLRIECGAFPAPIYRSNSIHVFYDSVRIFYLPTNCTMKIFQSWTRFFLSY